MIDSEDQREIKKRKAEIARQEAAEQRAAARKKKLEDDSKCAANKFKHANHQPKTIEQKLKKIASLEEELKNKEKRKISRADGKLEKKLEAEAKEAEHAADEAIKAVNEAKTKEARAILDSKAHKIEIEARQKRLDVELKKRFMHEKRQMDQAVKDAEENIVKEEESAAAE